MLEWSSGSIKILMPEQSTTMVLHPSKKTVMVYEQDIHGTRFIARFQGGAQVEDAIITAQSLLLDLGLTKKLSDTE